MTDTFVTLHGWLGGDVQVRSAGDTQVASFRLGCTPRRYQRRSDSWVDCPTQWYTVSAWRALGANCRDSLRRGDPVVVHGRLEARAWVNGAGVEVTSMEVEATSVGHDLSRGVSRFLKNAPREAAPAPQPATTVAADSAVDTPSEEQVAAPAA
jgi:single-strand DNA-binding protein